MTHQFKFESGRDTVAQISDLLVECRFNRFQKQFLMSVMSWGMEHTITEEQKAAIVKIANKSAVKSRCEDAPCCGCCK